MSTIRANILSAVLIALAIVAAGCAASDGDRQVSDGGPSADLVTLEATTVAPTEDSPPPPSLRSW